MSSAPNHSSSPAKGRSRFDWRIWTAIGLTITLLLGYFLSAEIRRHRALIALEHSGFMVQRAGFGAVRERGAVVTSSRLPEILGARLPEEFVSTWFVRVEAVSIRPASVDELREPLLQFERFPEIEILAIEALDLSDEHWEWIVRRRNARSLFLYSPILNGDLRRLSELSQLQEAHLGACYFDEAALAALESLKSPPIIQIQNDELHDSRSPRIQALRRRGLATDDFAPPTREFAERCRALRDVRRATFR